MMTEAVGAESLTTLRQHTETLTTMTIVGDETSVTNSDAKINSENQTEKSTTSTAVGSEVTTTPRQQTKTSLTTPEAVVANPVIDDVETTMTDNPSDVEFDTNTADNEKDTTDNADDPLDEEFRAIDTFVTSLTVAKPSHHCTTNLAKVDPPDGCIDMSTYCTQNVHGLWRLATDEDGKRLSNHPRDTTKFEHLIASMKVKCLDVYFLQDTWLEDDEFDVDIGGYHVFRHNGPNGNHLHHGVAIVLSPRYYAGWKAAGAAPPIITDTASEFIGRFIGITIKLESRDKRGRTIKGKKKKETSLVLSLVSAYHPCHTEDDHERFLDVFDTLLSKLPPSEIIMGADINANVGRASREEEDNPFAPALGPHGLSNATQKAKTF
jgi:hypothetical protein